MNAHPLQSLFVRHLKRADFPVDVTAMSLASFALIIAAQVIETSAGTSSPPATAETVPSFISAPFYLWVPGEGIAFSPPTK